MAFLQYTGGTTGVAKGAMLTHRNMVANLLQMAAFWKDIHRAGPGRSMITPLPLYHMFCLTCDCLLFMQHGGLSCSSPTHATYPNSFTSFANGACR